MVGPFGDGQLPGYKLPWNGHQGLTGSGDYNQTCGITPEVVVPTPLPGPGAQPRGVSISTGALQQLASPLLISEEILNAAKWLEDHMILVLYPLRPSVEVIEMLQDFPEPLIVLGEPGLDSIEAAVDGFELLAQEFN